MAYISCPFHWYWAKIQDYWNKEMYFNHSLLAAICSDWYSTGSMWPDCNWTVKFCSQWTSHMKPSATSTTGSPDLLESTFKRALEMHLFSTARRHWDVFMILAPNINISRLTYLLTYKLEGRSQNRENLPVKDRHSTTVPRNQHKKVSHTGAEPGIILPFNFSIALRAASALLNSRKQYPAGFLEINKYSKCTNMQSHWWQWHQKVENSCSTSLLIININCYNNFKLFKRFDEDAWSCR